MAIEQLTFTNLPSGKGNDPNKSGFQIKAVSPGLSDEQQAQLHNLCMHYGDTVYRFAPVSATNKEDEWRKTITQIDSMPENVLDEFPTVWNYTQLSPSLFALTRTCYLGWTHDGRTGNFFSHALIFPPTQLEECNFNPMILTHSQEFQSRNRDDDTSLPVLHNFKKPSDTKPSFKLVLNEPFKSRLAQMISSLSIADPNSRVLLICLSDWRDAATLAEELLNLMPPKIRSRTTLCTYESDRKWLIPTPSGERPKNLVATHNLIILNKTGDRSFDIRPDEYKSSFIVFNFAENEFSPMEKPSRYADFAAECVLNGTPEQLITHHALAEKFQLEQTPDILDVLVDVVPLYSSEIEKNQLLPALDSLLKILESANHPKPIDQALDLLIPHVTTLSKDDPLNVLSEISDKLALLINHAENKEHLSFMKQLYSLISQAIADGRGLAASALLKVYGSERKKIIFSILKEILSREEPLEISVNKRDAEQMVNILSEGFALFLQESDNNTLPETYIFWILEMAKASGQIQMVWKQTKDQYIKPFFETEWNEEKLSFLEKLLNLLTVDCFPEANLWLIFKLIEWTKPENKELLDLLVKAVQAVEGSMEPKKELQELIRVLRNTEKDLSKQAVALGYLSDATSDTTLTEVFLSEYLNLMADDRIKDQRETIRKNLLQMNVLQPAKREFINDLIPWKHESGLEKFKYWHQVLDEYPEFYDAICREISIRIPNPDFKETEFSLVETLLKAKPNQATTGQGHRSLVNAVILGLPLQPLKDPWFELLKTSSDQLSQTKVKARFQVMVFMKDVTIMTQKNDWSIQNFPLENNYWPQVKFLDEKDRLEAVSWLSDIFKQTGITSSEDAKKLIEILEHTGEIFLENISNVVGDLCANRDPVTTVITVMSFAKLYLQGNERYLNIIKKLVDRLDRTEKKLFISHLESHFSKPDKVYKTQQQKLLNELGVWSIKPSSDESTPASAKSDSTDNAKKSGLNIIDFGKQLWDMVSGIKKNREAEEKKPKREDVTRQKTEENQKQPRKNHKNKK